MVKTVKIVFLIAGRGRRLNKITEDSHKSLICLDEFTMLHHLIENSIYSGFNEFIPIIGHCSNKIIEEFDKKYSKEIHATFITNNEYSTKNNLHSLYCAKDILQGEEFVLCNGDIVFDREILKNILKMEGLSSIAIDDYNYLSPIDSPGIKSSGDIISDLGRHIKFEENSGYAIGIYKFNKELSNAFFESARIMLESNPNAGFHDPLPELFNIFQVHKCRTHEMLWTDIDTFDDIEKAKAIHDKIKVKYI